MSDGPFDEIDWSQAAVPGAGHGLGPAAAGCGCTGEDAGRGVARGDPERRGVGLQRAVGARPRGAEGTRARKKRRDEPPSGLVSDGWFEYTLTSTVRDPSEADYQSGWVEDVTCNDLEYCRVVTVTMPASESVTNMPAFRNPGLRHGQCDDFAEVRGRIISRDAAAAAAGDPAQAYGEAFAWFSAPPQLVQHWPGPWPFDHPSMSWLYLAVGWHEDNRRMANDQEEQCTFPAGYGSATRPPSFAVSALQPYALYEVVDSWDKVNDIFTTDSDLPDGTVTCARFLKLRYWVGLTHHFSVFLPPDGAVAGFLPGLRFSTADLPPQFWDESAGNVDGRGALAAAYASTLRLHRVSLSWEEGGTVRSVSRTYPCAANAYGDFDSAAATRYTEANGSATRLAFFDPRVIDDDESGGPRAGAMTAFMGGVISGEVCVMVPVWGYDLDDVVEQGFHALFGSHVRITFEAEFFGPGGLDMVGRTGGNPRNIKRYFCVGPRALRRPLHYWIDNDTLRKGPYSNYLFRSFDADRVMEAASVAQSAAEHCECVPRDP